METQPKWFIASKTLLGVVATILPTLLPLFGIGLDPNDGVLFTDLADKIIMFAGAALAVYGRFVASGSLSATP